MNNTQVPLQEIETDNLSLAAFLTCSSCNLKEIKASSIPGKYLFVFYPDKKISTLESDFFSFKALIVPQTYYSAIRDVKRQLAEFKNRGR